MQILNVTQNFLSCIFATFAAMKTESATPAFLHAHTRTRVCHNHNI
jgi:ATP-dependent Clp protease adapter protein ClpS